MSNDNLGVIHNASAGGVAGSHEEATAPLQFMVAPSTGTEFNTVRMPLIPIACWRVDDIRFAFDSSFVTPDIAQELQALSSLRKQHSKADSATGDTRFPPLTIFGHADPVGSDDYNKALSGRRATVIYALLLSTTDLNTAVGLWRQVAAQEQWGVNQRQTMQSATGLADGTLDSELFQQYMQKLCPSDLQIARDHFLAQGADLKGKGDYQGCSEFNPMLVFSQEDQQRFAQAQQHQDQDVLEERNGDNAPNRRVVVLLFRPGSKVDPAKWPCPRATESKTGCIHRFWSDGEKRRSTHQSGVERTYEVTQDTFACRFFDRLSNNSPCSRIIELVSLKIQLVDDRVINGQDQPFDGISYRLEVGQLKYEGVAKGGVIQQLVPVGENTGTLTLLQKAQNGDAVVFWKVDLFITSSFVDSTEMAGAQVRLNNLGFYAGDQITGQVDAQTTRALQRFQALYKIADDQGRPDTHGNLTQQTADKLKQQYGS